MNIIQLKNLKKKLNNCKRDNSKPYFMSFTVENRYIKNISIIEEKGNRLKSYTEASEGFNRWNTYILSDEILKEHIEASESLFCIITQNQITIFTDEMEMK